MTFSGAATRRSSADGFTLIELIVTITIAAILLMLAAPSFVSYRLNSQLTAAANSFLAAATAARSEAMKRQLNAFVRPTDGVNWANGWSTYVDVDWSANYNSGDIQIGVSTPLPSVVLTTPDNTLSDGFGHYVMFTGAGFLADSTSNQPTNQTAITFTNGTDSRLVIMNASGRMRVCNPVGDATCTAANVF